RLFRKVVLQAKGCTFWRFVYKQSIKTFYSRKLSKERKKQITTPYVCLIHSPWFVNFYELV
ncbi:MAG: hypothetical protein ACYTBV_07375, partial [Planctomycetota bacterium]